MPEDPAAGGHGALLHLLWLILAGAWLYHQLRGSRAQFRFGWPDALMIVLVAWYAGSAWWPSGSEVRGRR